MGLVITVTFFRPTPTKRNELTLIIVNSIRQVVTYIWQDKSTRVNTRTRNQIIRFVYSKV